MEKLFNTASIIVGVAGGMILRLFGACDKMMHVLLAMMLLDYCSGVIKAIQQKRLSSEIGFKGLLKKVSILLIVAAANIIQSVIGENIAVREIVIMFYIANEGISLLENTASVSNRIPQKFKDVLLQLRGDDDSKS